MKNKIGFVDTDNQNQQKPTMGRIEDQENDRWDYRQNLLVGFLMVFGALPLMKETLVFLVGLEKRG